MKFGSRSDSDDAGEAGGSAGDSLASSPAQPLPPVPESPPPVAEHEVPPVPVAEHETSGSPGGEELPVARVEPVVEGSAYEIPADEPPEALTVHQHEPEQPPPAMPFPVAEQPISVVAPGPGPAPVTTLGDSGDAFASGHAAAPGPSWQEPVLELAHERPELAVGAAFVGGLLAAMILRRLGN
ncbi:MAG TPA: hypothetical protein VGV90_18850 [Solirubrobacteraceae bacterium]|nr:hypothetical protein [Solirubrobacteraceae bacterium]